jgi:hypothetical protein
MSTPLRSERWSVRPSFVPNGPTSPVTLLCDDSGLTQLAGEPVVAWQTPWSELANLQLVRFARGVVLFATADGVRYCWRNRDLADFEALREVVLAHGGSVERRRRRAGALVVAFVVLFASLAGGIGALLNRGSSGERELAAASAVNLSLKDLPSSWSSFPVGMVSPLSTVFPPADQVVTSSTTPTTTAPPNSVWGRVTSLFQRCLGVSAARDRVYGAAGQMPDYQVSSRVFTSPLGDVTVASTAQYYSTTAMVKRDTAEMSKSNFGSCFTTSNVALILSTYGGTMPRHDVGVAWRPATFVRGWSRGGVAQITQPGATRQLHLVMVVATSGHLEVTLGALVAKWPESEPFLANLVNTLLSRMTSPSSVPV